ncbi:hypothetical protein SAMN04488494_0618 [Xylanibacter ruminicola]|uniref:Uncharacterized protein n=1 Tax=Xylanibacter ruminicola TaxID=839 RepID=A0A1M7D3Y3_XYLRU|nr:hypothetical protein [Xylanibacter ruminicola]SHL74097.1 hypothetical protein SAMN04488494_0618 [Xylanibacter ruminicola]
MSVNNGLITAPVSLADVNKALGTTHTVVNAACVDEHINIWSKYKPVKLSAILTTDQWDYSTNKWKDNANWFQGLDGAVCGLLPYKTSVFADVIANTKGGMNGWIYQRPTGDAAGPYRLQDFAGYNHNATPACEAFAGVEKMANGGTFAAGCAIAVSGSYNVSLADFGTQVYFGVAICNSNGGVVYHGTDSTAGGSSVQFDKCGIGNGSYTAYPFLCTEKITPTLGSFSKSYTFWTAPNLSPYKLVVTSSSDPALTGITASGMWLDKNHTSLRVTVRNTKTTQTGRIVVKRVGRKWSDPQLTDEKSSGTLTFTGNGNTTHTFTGMSNSYNYQAFVVLSGGQVVPVGMMEDFQPQL